MPQLQKKERNEFQNFMDNNNNYNHANQIAMLRAYGVPTWRKERHDKKMFNKVDNNQKLTANEFSIVYGDDEGLKY